MPGPSLRRAGNLLGLVVLAVAVVLAVLLVAPGLVGAEASLVVKSDSMSPAISAGDVVVVTGADATSLSAGTVVTYREPGGTVVTHRIVDVVETDDGIRYRTKGDANEEPDRVLVTPAQVRGTVWFTIPLLGHLVVFANTKLGLALLVIVPAIMLAGSELYSLYVDATSDQTNRDGGRQ